MRTSSTCQQNQHYPLIAWTWYVSTSLSIKYDCTWNLIILLFFTNASWLCTFSGFGTLWYVFDATYYIPAVSKWDGGMNIIIIMIRSCGQCSIRVKRRLYFVWILSDEGTHDGMGTGSVVCGPTRVARTKPVWKTRADSDVWAVWGV
jgi:hypothetical protein